MEKLENIDEYYTGKAWKDPGALQVLEACLHLDREKKRRKEGLEAKAMEKDPKKQGPKKLCYFETC